MHFNMKYLKAAYDGQRKCNLHGPGQEMMDSLTKVTINIIHKIIHRVFTTSNSNCFGDFVSPRLILNKQSGAI